MSKYKVSFILISSQGTTCVKTHLSNLFKYRVVSYVTLKINQFKKHLRKDGEGGYYWGKGTKTNGQHLIIYRAVLCLLYFFVAQLSCFHCYKNAMHTVYQIGLKRNLIWDWASVCFLVLVSELICPVLISVWVVYNPNDWLLLWKHLDWQNSESFSCQI